jgi:hypothetical protein
VFSFLFGTGWLRVRFEIWLRISDALEQFEISRKLLLLGGRELCDGHGLSFRLEKRVYGADVRRGNLLCVLFGKVHAQHNADRSNACEEDDKCNAVSARNLSYLKKNVAND